MSATYEQIATNLRLEGETLVRIKTGKSLEGFTSGKYLGVYVCPGAEELLHRVKLALHLGHLPVLVDHQNGNKMDNRLCNLREATRSQNVVNSRRQPHVYPRGVARHGRGFKAQITIQGRNLHIGTFDTVDDAAEAYHRAALHHHGEFYRREE